MTDLERVAYKAWDEFYRHMERKSRKSSRNNFFGHRYQKAFMRIGEICTEHKLSVVDFVEENFNLVQRNTDYITPRDFTSPKAVDNYLSHRKEFRVAVDNDWRTQVMRITEFEVRMIPEDYPHTEALLMDPALQFTACFRVLYPEHFSEWLCKVYGPAAREALQADGRLRDFVRKHAPANLQELERRLGALNQL